MEPAKRSRTRDPSIAETPLCIVGETVREVVVLSEAEWSAIPERDRPSPAEYFPGLGWVCATPRPRRVPG